MDNPNTPNGDRNQNNQNNNAPRKQSFLFIVAALLSLLCVSYFMKTISGSNTDEITYNEFIQKLEDGEIDTVVIGDNQLTITPKKTQSNENVTIPGSFMTGLPATTTYITGKAEDDTALTERLLQYSDVKFQREVPESSSMLLYILLYYILPILLMWGLLSLLFRRISKGGGGFGGMGMGVGKSNAKVYVEAQTGKSFADVAGQDEAKEALMELVDFLHNPAKYQAIGANMPKGALLVGPPGTGKTLLAKAVAGEAKVPFFSISGSEFIEMFVGMGAARVRDLFKQAQEKAPCIVFIDEIDAIGKRRDSGQFGGNDEREQTLNQLLSEMDGFDGSKGVVILAATNRPESLDKALLRPGRFDRRIPVELPDLQGREAILKVHAKAIKTCDDIDYLTVARATAGASGAELANIVNEAALRAVKMNRTCVSQSDLEESVEVVIAGYQRKGAVIPPEEKKIVAYHEIGHALVAALQKKSAPVHKITIIPRTSGALGYTMQVSETDNVLMSKEELFNKIVTITGGRSAEEVIFNSITSGASNDIEQATKLARAMVTRLGMTEEFDMMATETMTNIYLGGDPSLNCSDETASKIDAKVLEIIKEAHQKAREILEENKEKLHELAAFLLERETITGEEFMRLLNSEADVIETSATVVKEGEADAEEASSI